MGYIARRRNYERFRRSIVDASIPLITVECAVRGSSFELPQTANVIAVRTGHTLWQKERLLNIAVAHAAARWPKIAWLDCDILFERSDWAVAASHLLETSPMVQLFDKPVWLSRGTMFEGTTTADDFAPQHLSSTRGFAALTQVSGPAAPSFGGVTGFAWAARSDLLSRHGLYDACIVGGGDAMIACAAVGQQRSNRALGVLSPDHMEHYLKWADVFTKATRGTVNAVAGHVLHLWHGPLARRRYGARHELLLRGRFDPEHDVQINEDGCWEWTQRGLRFERALQAYLAERKEDA
jgi:hypothetical protein